MIIKEAVYKEEQRLVTVELEPEIHGCDHCGKEIEPGKVLQITIFYDHSSGKESIHQHYCTWECVLRDLVNIKCDSFLTLPYVEFSDDVKDHQMSGNRLIEIIKKIFI